MNYNFTPAVWANDGSKPVYGAGPGASPSSYAAALPPGASYAAPQAPAPGSFAALGASFINRDPGPGPVPAGMSSMALGAMGGPRQYSSSPYAGLNAPFASGGEMAYAQGGSPRVMGYGAPPPPAYAAPIRPAGMPINANQPKIIVAPTGITGQEFERPRGTRHNAAVSGVLACLSGPIVRALGGGRPYAW